MAERLVRLRVAAVGCLLLVGVAFAGGRPVPAGAPAAQESVTRCGWFENPTPANGSLLDREAEWIVGVQGGHQAEGDWPSFGKGQWVETNGHYGYGCACLRLRADP